MKIIPYFLFLCIVTYSIAAETIHEWTNLDGKTIRAQFVKSDGNSVTILLNGRKFDYPLAKLNPESQALARKLSAGNAPTNGANPFGNPSPNLPTKPKPAPGGDKSKEIGGKILLPMIGEGRWARFHAVTVGKSFDVAVHGNGRIYFFLKDEKGEVIGQPLRLSYRIGFYTKPDRQFGWPHAYYKDYSERHYKLRKVVSFEAPSAPATASGFRRLELTAIHQDDVKMELGIEVSGNRVAVWGKPVDPRNNEYASVMAMSLSVPAFFEIKDGWRAPDWTPVVGDTTISATPVGSRRAVDLPYLQKWADLKQKGLYPSEIQEAELHGKLFGKRKVSLASKSFRDLRFTMGSYSGIFPFQDYHFIYKDTRNGGEIDRARRLEIEIR